MKFSKKVYKNTPEYALYIKARFADRSSHSFGFDGHRWAYEHTSFDDTGNYDLLYRFTDDEVSPVETSDDLSVRDYMAATQSECLQISTLIKERQPNAVLMCGEVYR